MLRGVRPIMRMSMLVRLIGPIGIIIAGCFFFVTVGSAKPDYTRRTNKDCEFCHPPKSRELNEAGKYYQEHKNSLVGYKPTQSSQTKPSEEKAAPPPPRKSQ
jgi:hypothetical protein